MGRSELQDLGMKSHSWPAFCTLHLGLALLSACLTSPAQAASRWQWPVTPHTVVRAFTPPAKPWLPGHRGIDLSGHAGQTVHSAGSGFVTYASSLAGRGVVTVQHGTLRTTYEPVTATVSVGEFVFAGDTIGYLAPGLSHCSRSGQVQCLHWGLRRGFSYLNPLMLVGGYVRLLPVP
jgi:murein DD-endopeptidase MepM/ murein hydrolase activator NlpD